MQFWRIYSPQPTLANATINWVVKEVSPMHGSTNSQYVHIVSEPLTEV